jgi:hypothetical protein
MSRRIDERELVQLLRDAGADIELDLNRIMAMVDAGATAPRTGPLRRPVAKLRQRRPIELLALPMAAALAVGLVVVVKGGVGSTPEHIKIVTGRTGQTTTASGTPGPSTTSELGDARSITAPSQTPAAPAGGNARAGGNLPAAPPPQSPTSGNTSIQVAPVPQGSTYKLPAHPALGWLLVGSAPDGSQPRSQSGGGNLGPAQVMGQSTAIEVGPYDLSWASGSATTTATQSGTWLTVPGSMRGVASGLRVPVRVHRFPATITLYAGTVGGGGHITVAAGSSRMTAELPSCTQPICPAVITIQLGQQNASDATIDLNATGADTKVGLAAVELD